MNTATVISFPSRGLSDRQIENRICELVRLDKELDRLNEKRDRIKEELKGQISGEFDSPRARALHTSYTKRVFNSARFRAENPEVYESYKTEREESRFTYCWK